MKRHNQTKYGGPQYEGPCLIVTVNDNGTVRIKRGNFYDTLNIRTVKHYFEWTDTVIMGASAIYAV